MIRPLRLGAAALVVLALTTACGSSGSKDAPAAPPPQVSDSGGASGSAGTAATTDPTTLAAISKAYATFFASTSSTAQSQAVLQHGERFTATLAEQAKSSYATTSTAEVNSAELTSPDVATVTFTITSGGSPLLSKIPGYAVRTAGRWQVAAQTFCGLLKLEHSAPAACDDDAVTALPH